MVSPRDFDADLFGAGGMYDGIGAGMARIFGGANGALVGTARFEALVPGRENAGSGISIAPTGCFICGANVATGFHVYRLQLLPIGPDTDDGRPNEDLSRVAFFWILFFRQ